VYILRKGGRLIQIGQTVRWNSKKEGREGADRKVIMPYSNKASLCRALLRG